MSTLKDMRLEKKYNQTEMSQRLGVTLRTYRGYENGDRRPGLEMILELAGVLDKTAGTIILAVLEKEKQKRRKE